MHEVSDSQWVHTSHHNDIEQGVYRHYKGGLYRVLGIAHEEATLQPVVVYEPLHESETLPRRSMWTRPLHEFTESVKNAEGVPVIRFAREVAYDHWFL